jgi:glyoxylase I family protein
MTNPAIIGLGHLDFTVTDGDRAVRWWQAVMGFNLLAEWEHAGFRAGRSRTPAAWLSQL